jgi:hypothetical protein
MAAVYVFEGADRGRDRLCADGGAVCFRHADDDAANAIFLQYTAPIYVAIIGTWYLGERPLRIDWLVMRSRLADLRCSSWIS